MNSPDGGKHAVVLSGGGADGAYSVGVMKALFSGQSPATDYRPLDPDILTGTSIGSYNAAFLVSQWARYGPAAVNNLEQVWRDQLSYTPETCGHGVFRVRATPLEFLNPVCFIPNPLRPFIQLAEDSAFLAWDGLQRFINVATEQDASLLQRLIELFNFSSFLSTQPMTQALYETIRFEDIRHAEKVLRIAATNWETGDLQVFTNRDMTDQLGLLAILASSAIPGFFPPVKVGSQAFVDGGVLMNTPMQPAIDAGADILHVIYLDPEVKNIPLASLENTLETMYRQQTIAWAQALNNEIRAVRHINRELAYARLIADSLGVLQQRAPDENLFEGIPVRDIEQYLQESLNPKYKELTVHRYHPRDDLGGVLGVLNFERERIQHLIDRGFDDAVDYDTDSYDIILPVYLPALPLQPASGE